MHVMKDQGVNLFKGVDNLTADKVQELFNVKS